MKKYQKVIFAIVVLAVILITGRTNQVQSTAATTQINTESLRVAEIELKGMYCQSCAISSKNTLKNTPGVKDAEVDFNTKRGTVIYDVNILTKEKLIDNYLIRLYEGKVLSDNEYKP